MRLVPSTFERAWLRLRGAAGRRRAAWSFAVACAAVLLVAAALAGGRAVSTWARPHGGQAQLVVYLAQDTDAEVRARLAEELGQLGGVTGVETVAPEEALRRLRTALAADQALLDGVEPETMPASLEASLEPGLEAVLPMSPTFAALRQHAAVEDVVIEPAPPDTLASAMRALAPWTERAALLVAGLAALCLFAVVRLAFALPRQELAVARLLGAGPAFHLIPMALAAALVAALDGLAATVTLWLMAPRAAALVPGAAPRLVELGALIGGAALVAAAGAARAARSGEAGGAAGAGRGGDGD